MLMFRARLALMCSSVAAVACLAAAQPSSVEHAPSTQTFNQAGGITQREPDVARDGETVDLYMRVSFQFTYDRVCVYYTTDGSEPSGSFGTPSGTTQVLRNDLGSVSFLYNENSGGTRDWWRATLPSGTRSYGQTIKYKLSAWKPFVGGEVFANGGASYSYTNKIAWPGAGAGQANPGAGYPPVSFWKEEAIFGNTYTAGQLDQNGTVYDFHFPTPGGVGGVGTRNEGYVDGVDTFPPGLPAEWRGQMHINQAMPGIRVDGVTHWLSNPNGVSFQNVQQSYVADSNTVLTSQRLFQGGTDINVQQYDFAPIGITFPTDNGGGPQRHIYIKRLILTNNGVSTKNAYVYWYLDPAINGGDGYDAMFVDPAKAAMVAYDNTYRNVTGTGTGFVSPNEYNPTTFSGYEKNKSLYLASAMKVLNNAGAIVSTATDFWRDTSGDNGQGWMGAPVTLPPGQNVEIDFIMAGGVDDFAGASGTYAFRLANVVDWFYATSVQGVQSSTDSYWSNWLNSGVTATTPDADVNEVMRRGLLATALHCDAVNGGVIAGFHNGAYPYVWPRDAVYAAITLARTGHLTEARNVYEWMKNTTYRDFESWGRKGFWKQKYSTDGYVIWGAPQIDETAVFPWGVNYQYKMTGDTSMLNAYVEQVRDAVQTMTRDSSDSRLRYEEAFNLVYSNNVWEDSYDTFIYSNANIVRGLQDAGSIFSALGLGSEAADANAKAGTVKSGLDARLDWDGENTDVSQLGIVYPFQVYSPTDFRSARVMDRINGVKKKFNNTFCCTEPLINYSGQHQDTINRYWGDNYWNGGPWFLSTLWYGLFYAERADYTSGTGDIDNHKYRLDLMIDRLGPAGMGAEQIAYNNSLLYPAQSDFVLQTAWPNAWESMSTLVDAVMAFLDFVPDAPSNTFRIDPKLPSAWTTMTFNNVTLVNTPAGHTHKVNVTVTNDDPAGTVTVNLTNTSGFAVNADVNPRIPSGQAAKIGVCSVTVNGTPIAQGIDYLLDPATGRVDIAPQALSTGANAVTSIVVNYGISADVNDDNVLDLGDFFEFLNDFDSTLPGADIDGNPGVDLGDFFAFLNAFDQSCL
jgi:GH15 family glucan-1,4-alpha-glucosidase